MKVGVIGLGRMGGPIARKLQKSGAQLTVYDIDPAVRQEFENLAIRVALSIEALSEVSDIIWVMVPAPIVDTVLRELCSCTKMETIVIDGGNSYFKDTIRRGSELAAKNLKFLDCGTSGGLWGADRGFSLTIGGNYQIFLKAEEVFKVLAASPQAYIYVGPSGSGHYVKMAHNGIEYALLQSYAEGLHLLHDGHYENLDLAAITDSWLHGAVIRSWILQLAHDVLLYTRDFESVNGAVGEHGTGRWTVEEAHKYHIPVKLIEDALKIRQESRTTGGNFATKVVALLRHQMGGHSLAQPYCSLCQKVI
jgi:6-phosphogluconate dehydrogenase